MLALHIVSSASWFFFDSPWYQSHSCAGTHLLHSCCSTVCLFVDDLSHFISLWSIFSLEQRSILKRVFVPRKRDYFYFAKSSSLSEKNPSSCKKLQMGRPQRDLLLHRYSFPQPGQLSSAIFLWSWPALGENLCCQSILFYHVTLPHSAGPNSDRHLNVQLTQMLISSGWEPFTYVTFNSLHQEVPGK